MRRATQGDWRSALRVQERMQSAGVAPTVHVFNALIAACDRAHQYEKALSTAREMQRVGVPANSVTQAVSWRGRAGGKQRVGEGRGGFRQGAAAGLRCVRRPACCFCWRLSGCLPPACCSPRAPAPALLPPQLLEGVCKEGTREVESQQAAAAALSAAVAAAGTLMIRAGIF